MSSAVLSGVAYTHFSQTRRRVTLGSHVHGEPRQSPHCNSMPLSLITERLPVWVGTRSTVVAQPEGLEQVRIWSAGTALGLDNDGVHRYEVAGEAVPVVEGGVAAVDGGRVYFERPRSLNIVLSLPRW